MKRATPSGLILILAGADEAMVGGHDAEAVLGVDVSVQAIRAALVGDGHEVALARVDDIHSLVAALRAHRPSMVVNLVESLGGRDDLEPAAAAVLELLRVPYTGSAPVTLGLCKDKPLTKTTLVGLGVPTARWHVWSAGDSERANDSALQNALTAQLTFPVIVKPAATDASCGIDASSVVPNAAAALARARLLWAKYGPEVLVEEFVDGRELNIGIVGNGASAECLPLAEIEFRVPPGMPAIVTYDAKWIDGSAEWGASSVRCPAAVDDALAERLRDVALRAYRGLGVRDYGRVDVRVNASGEIHVLEVNPNPDLAPDAGFANAARARSWSYDELVRQILLAAEARNLRDAALVAERSSRDWLDPAADRSVLAGGDRVRPLPRG